jgi:aldose 1-epimerase
VDEYEAGDVRLRVEPRDGCRLRSLEVAGDELLAQEEPSESHWGAGSFVMAPWAGRLRRGHVEWGGRQRSFPLAPQEASALHGLVHDAAWTPVSPGVYEVEIGDRWLSPCRLRQVIRLEPDALHLRLEAHALAPVPVTLGWHPWFHRRLDGAELDLQVRAGWALERDADKLPTGRRTAVPDGPMDDTLGDVQWPIRLTWPQRLQLEIDSDATVAVVYTQRPDLVCVEPQSGPPDEPNLHPRLARPGAPVEVSTTWRWTRLDG